MTAVHIGKADELWKKLASGPWVFICECFVNQDTGWWRKGTASESKFQIIIGGDYIGSNTEVGVMCNSLGVVLHGGESP